MIDVRGLDLSHTSTGLATRDGTTRIQVAIREGANYLEKVQRLHRLVGRINRACQGAAIVVIEGYAPNSKYGREIAGELAGAVKLVLFQQGIPFILISPPTLKKYATNNGRAGKDQVLAAAVRENPSIESNDEADAWWLYHMGLAHYEQHDHILPKYRREVLESIQWPELEERQVASG